ncbi:SRPBCC family protein [Brevibacterium litoralis]|uniref:SRPBCC family protein n=1 Tax=Brevibacterium litoralis TaxID=3138935 RepID=UPI0032ED7A41
MITLARTFDAPADLVWRAWTDPALARRWWHPFDARIRGGRPTIDPRVGGEFSYVMKGAPEGSVPVAAEAPVRGIYRVLEPERRLVADWSYRPDSPEARIDAVLTVDLSPTAHGLTRMDFTLDVTHAPAGADVTEEGPVGQGWSEAFEQLDIWFAMGIM